MGPKTGPIKGPNNNKPLENEGISAGPKTRPIKGPIMGPNNYLKFSTLLISSHFTYKFPDQILTHFFITSVVINLMVFLK